MKIKIIRIMINVYKLKIKLNTWVVNTWILAKLNLYLPISFIKIIELKNKQLNSSLSNLIFWNTLMRINGLINKKI